MEDTAKTQASTVNKAIRIVNLLAENPDGIGINALCRLIDTQKPGMLRIMRALSDAGWVVKDAESGHYRLGYQLLTLATQALLGGRFQEITHAGLRRLAFETGETANLGVLDRTRVVFMDQVESQRPFRLMVRIGSRAPVYCTALGKALAAHSEESVRLAILAEAPYEPFTERTITTGERLRRELDEVVRSGYAIDREEHRDGVACIAAPIRNYWGEVVAALSISGAAKELMSGEGEARYARAVMAAADEVSAQLGYAAKQPAGGEGDEPVLAGEPAARRRSP